MLEIMAWSLFVGSLGVQTAAISGWMYRWQTVAEEQEQEEEEILTQYEAKESLAEIRTSKSKSSKSSKDPRLVGWEFKIVRAHQHVFRDPAILQRLCEEEAQAGWIMIEKLDDRRVRFKRPIAFRDVLNPEYLPNDPYRCHYGSTWQPSYLIAAIVSIFAVLLPAYLGYSLVKQTLDQSASQQTLPTGFPSLQKSIR